MFLLLNKKPKKGIATITIVLLLGFLSLLTITSIFTYNTWRWENLNNNIAKDRHNNAIDSATLMQYILIMRSRDTASGSLGVYDTYENAASNILTTVSIGSADVLSNCNNVELPVAYDNLVIKRITASNQYLNLYSSKTCCTAGIFYSSGDSDIQIEGLIDTYSKESCKNMNWPNLKNSSEPLITYNLTQ